MTTQNLKCHKSYCKGKSIWNSLNLLLCKHSLQNSYVPCWSLNVHSLCFYITNFVSQTPDPCDLEFFNCCLPHRNSFCVERKKKAKNLLWVYVPFRQLPGMYPIWCLRKRHSCKALQLPFRCKSRRNCYQYVMGLLKCKNEAGKVPIWISFLASWIVMRDVLYTMSPMSSVCWIVKNIQVVPVYPWIINTDLPDLALNQTWLSLISPRL